MPHKFKDRVYSNNLFCFTFPDGYLALLKNPDITMTDMRVLGLLVANMDYGNEVPKMTQHELAELIGIKRPHLTTSLKKLVELGAVIKDGKKLNVSPKYNYRGNIHDRDKDLEAFEAQKSKNTPQPKDSPADDENDVPF